ncbi:MAG: hypothetical protein NTW40_03820 [Acidobacteria bacterium]|nr:hypothetical protein [Acidobacteriota bacterium]
MTSETLHLIRHPLPADLLTPLAAYLALRPAGASLLLESCDQGERVGRHSFVLLEGEAQCRLEAPATGWVPALRELAGPPPMDTLHDPGAALPARREPLPVGVGCAGYLGFEAMGAAEPTLRLPAKNSLGLPGCGSAASIPHWSSTTCTRWRSCRPWMRTPSGATLGCASCGPCSWRGWGIPAPPRPGPPPSPRSPRKPLRPPSDRPRS